MIELEAAILALLLVWFVLDRCQFYFRAVEREVTVVVQVAKDSERNGDG